MGYMLKNKSNVQSTFLNWQQLVERQFGTKIKSVQTDGEREFQTLSSHFKYSVGINHRISCPHTWAQNGLLERKHRHVEMGPSLLAHSFVHSNLWDHVFDEMAVYIINRCK